MNKLDSETFRPGKVFERGENYAPVVGSKSTSRFTDRLCSRYEWEVTFEVISVSDNGVKVSGYTETGDPVMANRYTIRERVLSSYAQRQ